MGRGEDGGWKGVVGVAEGGGGQEGAGRRLSGRLWGWGCREAGVR